MKCLLILSCLLCLFVFIAPAQTPIWSVEAANYLGKIVSFDEVAYQIEYNPVDKICLIKLADPDVIKSPTITVVIHNVSRKRYINRLRSLEGFTIRISGKLLKVNGRFIINGNETHSKIEAEKEGKPLFTPEPQDPGPPPNH